MKAPEISITVTDLTLRFPVYGVDSKSLKKHLARITVGGKLGKTGLGAPEITALSKVNLQLRSGDRLGLIGHNGSGKTTLLRALAGAYEPDEGTIDVHGRIAGLSTKQIDERLTEIAEFTGLGPFLAMPLKTYSAGMQARLAFAVATAVHADVILMDEWIAVGDSDFKKLAHKRILDLMERAGILVLASHELDLIRLYCNKVMRIEAGVASPIMDVKRLDELLAAA